MIALNRILWAVLLAALLSLMTACTTVHDSYSGTKDTTGNVTRPGHVSKELVLTFPAWVNEAEKLSAIEASAKIKASTKCSNSPYTLTELLSEPFVLNIATGGGINIISANISCKAPANNFVEKPPVNSSDTDRIVNLPPCPISGYFSNCFGTFIDANNGNKYFGEWKNNKLNGQGTETLASGQKYVGEYKDGLRNGKGTYTFANGNQYVGEFKEGKFNGQGTSYASNGSITNQGLWADGNFVRSAPIQQAAVPNQEVERLRADAAEARRKQAEADEKMRVAEQQALQTRENERLRAEAEEAKRKQAEAELRLAQQTTPAQALTNNLAKPVAGNVRSAHALVIGNAAYPGSSRLDNPVNDANAISQKLRSMGFIVTTVTDANRQRLVQAMAQFRRTAAKADMSLLYYAGHGIQVFGTNYILPTDVDQTDPAQATIQGVSLNSVVENFLPGKTKLVFLDACRDNPLQRTSERGVSRGLAPISVSEGTLISYATRDGQTAADGTGKNSPYTTALLEHIGDPDDIAVVLRKVREKVMKSTGNKQQPWEYGSLIGGALVLSAIKPK